MIKDGAGGYANSCKLHKLRRFKGIPKTFWPRAGDNHMIERLNSRALGFETFCNLND